MSENNTLFDKLSCNGRYKHEFKEKALIGNGSFGQVYKVFHSKEKQYYAIKKIDFNAQHFKKTPEKFKDECLKEIRFMETLKEDYIVNYITSWSEYEDMFYIQMELCETDLNYVLRHLRIEFKRNPLRTTSWIKYYISSELFNEILEALDYLHLQNPPIIHRDLKPDNILITNGVKGRFVKLADFGLSVFHEREDQSHTEDAGNREYMAPEVKNGRHYDTRADVYSLGLIARKLFYLSSIIPIDDLLLADMYASVQNLITKMTSEEIEKRPNCQQILNIENSWYLNIETLSKDSIYKNIIESKLNQSMIDCFHKYFIRKKYSKISRQPEFCRIVPVLGEPIGGVIGGPIGRAIVGEIVSVLGGEIFSVLCGEMVSVLGGVICGPINGVIGEKIGGVNGEPIGGVIGEPIGGMIDGLIDGVIGGPIDGVISLPIGGLMGGPNDGVIVLGCYPSDKFKFCKVTISIVNFIRTVYQDLNQKSLPTKV